MTTRYSGFIVTLGEDVRDDDAAAVLNALRQIKGVGIVEPVKSEPAAQIAAARVRREVAETLIKTIDKLLNPASAS